MYFLYPLILFLIPVHAAFANNYLEVPKRDYVKALIFMEITIGLLLLGCLFLINNQSLAALIFSLNFAYLLNANILYIALFSEYKRSKIRYFVLFCVYSVSLMSLLSLVVYSIFKNVELSFFDAVMFWGSLIITGFIAADVLPKFLKSFESVDIQKTVLKKNLPDIYHIVLDSHPGFYMNNLCDEYFEKELKKCGFKVFSNFKSNYKITAHSIPSMFNMSYIHEFVKPTFEERYLPNDTYEYYAKNEVFKVLYQYNYKFNFYTHACFNYIVEKNKKNLDIANGFVIGGNSVFKVLYFNSIFSSLYKVFKYKNPVNEIFNAFAKGIKKKFNKPVYHYMHVLAPHTPYLMDEKGESIIFENQYKNEYFFPYIKYIDKMTLNLINKIKEEMNSNSLIIIHSDHNHERWNDESFNILMAIYFPKNTGIDLFEENNSMSLVNFFRIIFNKLFDCNFELKEDKYYYTDSENFVIREVKQSVKLGAKDE